MSLVKGTLVHSTIVHVCWTDKCIHLSPDRWKEASKLLAKHTTITEILEVPSLIESAIKNGSYDDALKLHLFIKKLASSKYLNDIPILKQLTYQCENLIATLASKLLRDLRSNLQLPLCLKIVSQLRKLDLFSETEIRIKFLTVSRHLHSWDLFFFSFLLSLCLLRLTGHFTASLLNLCWFNRSFLSLIGSRCMVPEYCRWYSALSAASASL